MRLRNIVITMILLSILSLTSGCMRKTGPNEVGIRVKKFTLGKKGVENKVYPPASIYFFMPFINDWYTIDTKQQVVEMAFNSNSGDRKTRDDLVFKTIDGNDLGLDVIITYRIDPNTKITAPDGTEWLAGPYIIQYVGTNNHTIKEKIVRTITRAKSRDVFSELKTEQFYVARDRDTKATKAVDELNKIFSSYGIFVERVGTGDYRFNPKYADAIESKIKADADVERLRSEKEEKIREFEIRVAEKQAEVNKRIATIDGQFEQAKMMADAYYTKQEKIAEATLREGEAQAKGIMAKRKALSSSGGKTLVRLEIVKALRGKKIKLIPTGGGAGAINLVKTDVNDLLRLEGMNSLSSTTPPPQAPQ